MEGRQSRERDRVSAGDRELDIAVVQQLSAKRTDVDMKIAAAPTCLDRDLPKADDAERDFAAGVSDQRTGGGGEPPALRDGPEQNVRVQQEFHSSSP